MRRVTAAVAVKGGRVLLARRREGDEMGGYWEFPGGEVEEGESDAECLRREIREELGVSCSVLEKLGEFEDPEAGITLVAYLVDLPEEGYKLASHREVRWVYLARIERYQMPPLDREIVKKLRTLTRP